MTRHPWEILIDLVKPDEDGNRILTHREAHDVILAHQDANRRALMEVHALLPELMAKGLIEQEGSAAIQRVVIKAARDGMPDA